MQRIVSTVFSAILLLTSVSAAAQESPDPDAWFKKWRDTKSKSGIFPHRIMVLRSLKQGAQPKFMEIDKLPDFGFIEPTAPEQVETFLLLNERPPNLEPLEEQKNITPADWVGMLFEVSGGDTIAYYDGAKWNFQGVVKGKPRSFFAIKGPEFVTFSEFYDFMAKSIGYDGVVLDVDGQNLLIGSFTPLIKENTQALVIQNSAGRFRLKGKNKEGAALVELVKKGTTASVFKVLLKGKTKTRLGSKLIIEKAAQN
ncbi:MAG: hypothetical protein AB7T49_20930 [Oligoflexales bacterium]